MRSIFVSSTFKDMQYERDLLNKYIFPEINEIARKYKEEIHFTDLRWGVNTEELDSEEGSKKVLQVCFDEILKCEPYMIIFLGERYGWIPNMETVMDATSGYHIDVSEPISVTELEIQFGALSNKNLDKCIFCIREDLKLDNLQEDDRKKYLPEDELHKTKLELLKEKINQRNPKHVIHYSGEFDKNGNLKLSNHLREEIVRIISEDLEKEAKTKVFKTWQEEELDYAKSFVNESNSKFIGRENLISKLKTDIQKDNDYFFILRGKEGVGKSSILAKLYEEFSKEKEYDIFPFVFENNYRSEKIVDLFNQLNYFLQEILKIRKADRIEYMAEIDAKNEYIKLIEKYNKKFNLKRKLLILIDTVNSKETLSDVLEYDWAMPLKNQKIVLTLPENVDLPKNNEYILEKLENLDKADISKMIQSISAKNNKQLSKTVTNKILEKENSANPLYLQLLLQRLMMMDSRDFDRISKSGDDMEAINNVQTTLIEEMPDEIDKLYAYVLDSATEKIESRNIQEALKLLSIADYGLKVNDIKEVLNNNGLEINELEIASLVRYMKPFFNQKADGRILFANEIIKKQYYLKVEDLKNNISDKLRYCKMYYSYLKEQENKDLVDYIEIGKLAVLLEDNLFVFQEYMNSFDGENNKENLAQMIDSFQYEISKKYIGDTFVNLWESFIRNIYSYYKNKYKNQYAILSIWEDIDKSIYYYKKYENGMVILEKVAYVLPEVLGEVPYEDPYITSEVRFRMQIYKLLSKMSVYYKKSYDSEKYKYGGNKKDFSIFEKYFEKCLILNDELDKYFAFDFVFEDYDFNIERYTQKRSDVLKERCNILLYYIDLLEDKREREKIIYRIINLNQRIYKDLPTIRNGINLAKSYYRLTQIDIIEKVLDYRYYDKAIGLLGKLLEESSDTNEKLEIKELINEINGSSISGKIDKTASFSKNEKILLKYIKENEKEYKEYSSRIVEKNLIYGYSVIADLYMSNYQEDLALVYYKKTLYLINIVNVKYNDYSSNFKLESDIVNKWLNLGKTTTEKKKRLSQLFESFNKTKNKNDILKEYKKYMKYMSDEYKDNKVFIEENVLKYVNSIDSDNEEKVESLKRLGDSYILKSLIYKAKEAYEEAFKVAQENWEKISTENLVGLEQSFLKFYGSYNIKIKTIQCILNKRGKKNIEDIFDKIKLRAGLEKEIVNLIEFYIQKESYEKAYLIVILSIEALLKNDFNNEEYNKDEIISFFSEVKRLYSEIIEKNDKYNFEEVEIDCWDYLDEKLKNINDDKESSETLEKNKKLKYLEVDMIGYDPLINEVIEVLRDFEMVSTSFIQRKFRVGYARAGRIIDDLEVLNVIEYYRGKPERKVLINRKSKVENLDSMQELEKIFANVKMLEESILKRIVKLEGIEFGENSEWFDYSKEEYDPLIMDVANYVVKNNEASTTNIQRHFKIGYARTSYIIEQLERLRVISSYKLGESRKVLVGLEDLKTSKISRLKEEETYLIGDEKNYNLIDNDNQSGNWNSIQKDDYVLKDDWHILYECYSKLPNLDEEDAIKIGKVLENVYNYSKDKKEYYHFEMIFDKYICGILDNLIEFDNINSTNIISKLIELFYKIYFGKSGIAKYKLDEIRLMRRINDFFEAIYFNNDNMEIYFEKWLSKSIIDETDRLNNILSQDKLDPLFHKAYEECVKAGYVSEYLIRGKLKIDGYRAYSIILNQMRDLGIIKSKGRLERNFVKDFDFEKLDKEANKTRKLVRKKLDELKSDGYIVDIFKDSDPLFVYVCNDIINWRNEGTEKVLNDYKISKSRKEKIIGEARRLEIINQYSEFKYIKAIIYKNEFKKIKEKLGVDNKEQIISRLKNVIDLYKNQIKEVTEEELNPEFLKLYSEKIKKESWFKIMFDRLYFCRKHRCSKDKSRRLYYQFYGICDIFPTSESETDNNRNLKVLNNIFSYNTMQEKQIELLKIVLSSFCRNVIDNSLAYSDYERHLVQAIYCAIRFETGYEVLLLGDIKIYTKLTEEEAVGLMDDLEKMGIISQNDEAGKRKCLILNFDD